MEPMPEPEEPEILLEITLNGEPYEATRFNTTLYTFYGRVALRGMELDAQNFDHVFFQMGDASADSVLGGYLFRNQEIFEDLAEFITDNHWPSVLNQTVIPDCDVRAFESSMFGDLAKTNEVPGEWFGQ